MDDNDEKERIALNMSVVLFLFVLIKNNSIEGIENSISPLAK